MIAPSPGASALHAHHFHLPLSPNRQTHPAFLAVDACAPYYEVATARERSCQEAVRTIESGTPPGWKSESGFANPRTSDFLPLPRAKHWKAIFFPTIPFPLLVPASLSTATNRDLVSQQSIST